MRFFQFSLFSTKKAAPKKRGLRSSDPELLAMWRSVRERFFPHRTDLDFWYVGWSQRRQRRTLASCNMSDRRIVVAKELNYEDYKEWLDPLLYHEMCHAILGDGVERAYGKRQWHGSQFKDLESKHPKIRELDAWIKSGGWAKAIRSDRSKSYHQRRKVAAK